MLREDTEDTVLTDIVRIDFLELRKAKRYVNAMERESSFKDADEKLLWMYFINAETEEELNMLAQKNEIFKKPVAEVIRLSGDKAIRAQYEARQRDIMDRTAEHNKGIQIGIQIGMQKGMQKGMQENQIATAKKFLTMGLSKEKVMEGTGLSLECIEKLLHGDVII